MAVCVELCVSGLNVWFKSRIRIRTVRAELRLRLGFQMKASHQRELSLDALRRCGQTRRSLESSLVNMDDVNSVFFCGVRFGLITRMQTYDVIDQFVVACSAECFGYYSRSHTSSLSPRLVTALCVLCRCSDMDGCVCVCVELRDDCCVSLLFFGDCKLQTL